jgi:hypothetical protein
VRERRGKCAWILLEVKLLKIFELADSIQLNMFNRISTDFRMNEKNRKGNRMKERRNNGKTEM